MQPKKKKLTGLAHHDTLLGMVTLTHWDTYDAHDLMLLAHQSQNVETLCLNTCPSSQPAPSTQDLRQPPPSHAGLSGGPGVSTFTTSEAVLGLAPSGEPPSSLEQSGPASSSYSVRQSDSSPEMRSVAQGKGMWAGLMSPATPHHLQAQPPNSQGSPGPSPSAQPSDT
jgi:hypothetical protein